jgi:hypothetical protein
MGSSSLDADVNAFDKLHTVLIQARGAAACFRRFAEKLPEIML